MPRRTLAARLLTASLLAAGVVAVLSPRVGAEPGFTQVQAMPEFSGGAAYSAISCASSTVCVAVAYNFTEDYLSADTETSGVWGTPVDLKLPSGVDVDNVLPMLYGLSCPAEGACTAVGFYQDTDGATVPLLLTEVAGVWQAATTVTLPSGAATGANENAEMRGVDCVSVGNCVAVGGYADDSDSALPHAFALTQVSGGAWTTKKLADISGLSYSHFAILESLSCRDTSDCTVVGAQQDENNVDGVAWTESSGTWSAPTTITSAGLQLYPQSVACPDATTCIAVGQTDASFGSAGYAIETSGTWAAPRSLPTPTLSPKANEGELFSISCDTAAVCEAVGSFEVVNPSTDAYLSVTAGAATWSDGAWSSVGYVRGVLAGTSRASYAQLSSVSCSTITQCTAVGISADLAQRYPLEHAFSAGLTPVRAVTRPLPPSGVVAKGLPGGALTTWQAPVDDGGAPVLSFAVSAAPGGRSCTTAVESCVLRGLRNGHSYRVTVTDRTSYGSSAGAPDTTLVVAGSAPSTPTAGHLRFASNKLAVTWRASTSPAGEPVRYTVTIHEPHGVVRHLSTLHRSVIAPAGASGTYVVVIVATNASGASRPCRVHASDR